MKPYYADDAVTLYHGDCRDVLPSLPSLGLVLTDPPYGVTYASNYTSGQGVRPITNDGTRLSLRLYRTVLPLLASAEHLLWFTRWDAWPDVWGEAPTPRSVRVVWRHLNTRQRGRRLSPA